MKIAVIGGTGLQQMPDVEVVNSHSINTEYSELPVEIEEFRSNDCEFFFLGRHGAEQSIPPHLINYRANISALSQIGVDTIFAVTAVGGVDTQLGVGDLVIPDQILDYTWGRESTFFDGGVKGRRHIDFTYPYTDSLRTCLLGMSSAVDREVHDGGIYACAQGPRLETAAEVRQLQSLGVSVVGMTGMPEAALARELEMSYATVSVVVNPAAGLSGLVLSEDDILEECRLAALDISTLIVSAIETLQ